MAYSFHCVCIECNHEFSSSQGGGFTWYTYYCDQCGTATTFPRRAPRPNRLGVKPPFVSKSRERPAISAEDIRRFSEEELHEILNNPTLWTKWGDAWDDFEQEAMLKLKGACNCEGQWRSPSEVADEQQERGNKPHWLTRCPNCRSKQFQYSLSDVITD